MKTAFTFVGLVALGTVGAAQEMAAKSVRFGDARLGKGARFTVTSSNDSTVKMAVKGGGVQELMFETSTLVEYAYTVAVTACDEKGRQTATIDVARAHVRATSSLTRDTEHDCLATKVKWTATRGVDDDAWWFEGEGPQDSEARRTLEEIAARALGRAPLAAALAGRTLKVGDKVDVPVAEAKRLLATFAELHDVKSFELELTGTKQLDGVAVATFAAKVHFESIPKTDSNDATTIDLEGEIAVTLAQSIIVRASLAGPTRSDMTIGSGSGAVNMRGTGRLKWTFRAELR